MADPNQVFPPTYNAAVSTSASGAREINLRQEFFNTLFGSAQEIAKAQKGLLRKIRLDSSSNRIKCPCVDAVTQEGDVDYYCPVCLGERYLWDEYIVSFYIVEQDDLRGLKSKEIGLVNSHDSVIYLPYNTDILEHDRMIEINLDTEGNMPTPVRRLKLWELTNVIPLRSDNGKIEFIKLTAREKDVRYLNAPDR